MPLVPDPDGSTSPLRRDARRNRDRLVAAARELFAERGVEVAMVEIARHAGVSNGTLYNRFPSREHLLEAVFTDRIEMLVAAAETALADDDPWRGFADYLTVACELQANDRGFNEVAARGLTVSAATRRLNAHARTTVTALLTRAQRAGSLRSDVTVDDLAFVVWGIARTVDMTAQVAPRLWRRHLALLLDGFRADAAHPLPEPPMAPDQAHRPASR